MTEIERTFVSLYSGAGGMDRGFVDAGFMPLWANDFDADAVKTYAENIGDHVVHGDIEAVRGDLAGLRPALVIGGPPCQGFSVAGHMRPDDPRSAHVWTFLDVVDQLSPHAFVMENVASLAVNKRWSNLMEALVKRVRDIGYEPRVVVLNASHYGVPQARLRMFLLGMRGLAPPEPVPTTEARPPTVREVLAELPTYGRPGNDSICAAKVTPARRPVLRRSPFAGMLFNGKGRALDLDRPASTLPASMGGNRTPIVDQAQLDGAADECWVIQYHARLWAGRQPVKRIPKRMRRLTVEEAAAIQTFPKGWQFAGRQSSQFRQIGNAVPPALASHVAVAVDGTLVRLEAGEASVSAELVAA